MLGNGKKNIGYDLSSYTQKSVVAPVVYDADAVNYFNRVTAAGGTLTTAEKNAVNNVVLSLKSSGAWSKIITLYPFLGLTAATMSLNLKANTYQGTFFGGWTFSSLGAKPNGTNAYFDTKMKGFAEFVNEQLIGMSTYINEYSATPRIQMGTISANNTFNGIAPLVTSATSGSYVVARLNSFGATITQATPLKGFLGVNRNSTANYQYYKDGTEYTQVLAAQAGQYFYPIVMGAFGGYGGVIGNFDTARIGFGHVGNGLTSAEMLTLQSAVNTYTLALGRN